VELAGVAPAIVEMMYAAERAVADDWRTVVAQWVSGKALGELKESRIDVAQFIESDLIYRLVWGMEAARVYESAQGNPTAGTPRLAQANRSVLLAQRQPRESSLGCTPKRLIHCGPLDARDNSP